MAMGTPPVLDSVELWLLQLLKQRLFSVPPVLYVRSPEFIETEEHERRLGVGLPTSLGYAEQVAKTMFFIVICPDEWPPRCVETDSIALESISVNGVPDLCWEAKER
jgi:hypothetical protein